MQACNSNITVDGDHKRALAQFTNLFAGSWRAHSRVVWFDSKAAREFEFSNLNPQYPQEQLVQRIRLPERHETAASISMPKAQDQEAGCSICLRRPWYQTWASRWISRTTLDIRMGDSSHIASHYPTQPLSTICNGLGAPRLCFTNAALLERRVRISGRFGAVLAPLSCLGGDIWSDRHRSSLV